MSIKPTLPTDLSKILIGYQITQNVIGHTSTQVYRCQNTEEVLYLKISKTEEEIKLNYEMLCWLKNKLPVPEVKYWKEKKDFCYLLTTEAAGCMCCESIVTESYENTVKLLAEGILLLQRIDITNCHFDNRLDNKLSKALYNIENNLVDMEDWERNNNFETPMDLYLWLKDNKPEEEICFTHGDYCLPNVFIDGNKISAFIDLGSAGISDKYQDIALCVRSLKHNLSDIAKIEKDNCIDLLFKYLDLKPDLRKIEYYIRLDELF